MRKRVESDGLTVNAVAGTHVVFFGLDVHREKQQDFRGFAFHRHDLVEEETTWLRGMKTFAETEPHPAKGETFSTRDHPVQAFQWADYTVKPGRKYTYTVVALYGSPGALQPRMELEIPVTTEEELGTPHSAFFNRGSVATQEYARRFQNVPPNKAGQGAYDWLSRGLIEALIAFIDRASKGWAIHGAVYEFQWPAALAALRRASQRGAKVNVIFDDIEGYERDGKPKGPFQLNREAIAAAKIKALCKGRSRGKLMHNKFFVLSKNGEPTAVWTGSTNLTENGIFGHSNVGHVVEDPGIARAYLNYWERLRGDPALDNEYQSKNIAASPLPLASWSEGTVALFSPRGKDLDSLEWYAQIAGGAHGALFMTFAFGMHEKFKDVYRKDDNTLRMALLEKEGNNPRTLAREKRELQKIRKRPNVVMAIGNRIVTDSFDRWLAELSRITPGVHVYWIHTKYMLVDPLSASPTLVTGSANFSKASTDTNDENMLVIRGDKRIADIYLGEYLRLYTHYAFRESLKWHTDKDRDPESWQPQFLVNSDKWMTSYFDPGDTSGRVARRNYFAGPMAE